jgi:acetyltransferase
MMSAIFLAEMARRGIGIAKVCSIGNKMDVDECDLLPYLLEDEHTDVVALYLESIPRGRRLAEIAVRSAKPIVLLQGGRSQSGARAALSHTSSLAASSRLSDGVLESAGVIRGEDIYQMMDVANALAFLPRVQASCRTAIVTLSGGAGILACDALESRGIPVARLAEKTEGKLGEIFPPWMPVGNPVDLFPAMGLHGRSTALRRALSAVFDDPHTDVILVNLVVGLEEGLPDFEALRRKADTAGKAVLFWLMGRREETYRFHQKAREAGILAYREISRAAECLAEVAGYRSRQESPLPQFPHPAPDLGGKKRSPASYCRNRIWDEFDGKRLLSDWKIPVAAERTAHTVQEALSAADALGYPIVLKGLVPGEVHKTEQGLVALGIACPEQLKDAVGRMRDRLDGRGRMLVQRQLKIDYELIAGFIRDDRFGPCVMFGLGGILAELEPDVAFAMAPLDRAAALRLMEKIRNRRLLEGFRGMPALDKEKTAMLLMGLGDLGCANPEIEQIDINPIGVCGGAPVTIDASVILTEETVS